MCMVQEKEKVLGPSMLALLKKLGNNSYRFEKVKNGRLVLSFVSILFHILLNTKLISLKCLYGVQKRAQDIQAHNETPHLFSRGDYQKLDQKMVSEKMKARGGSGDDDGSADSIEPPSPPSRYEKWKQARLRKSGTWTSDESQRVAERIMSNFVSMF